MKLSPLQPMSHSQVCVSGDVTIHPSAVIAPGVLLQANPNSRIVIAAGACIGMGTILHADQGTLEVGESANLGTGVLFIGSGTIGANACIGSSSTLLNISIPKQQVLPSGSLLGDTSRHVSTGEPTPVEVTEAREVPKNVHQETQANSKHHADSSATHAPNQSADYSIWDVPPTWDVPPSPVSSTSKLSSEENKQTAASNPTQSSQERAQPSISVEKREVYGRAYVNQLLVKLMPHTQQRNQSVDDT